MSWFQIACRDALALVIPTWCVMCGAENLAVCDSCVANVRVQALTRSVSIAGSQGPTELHILSSCVYEDALRRLVLAFKEAGRSDVASALGGLLAPSLARGVESAEAVLRGTGHSVIYVVPMPSTFRSERQRGFRQVELLIRAALRSPYFRGRSFGVRVVVRRWLRVRRRFWGLRRRDQVGWSRAERLRNVQMTLVADARCRGLPIIIVDDLVTTGASLQEAHRAFTERGGCPLIAVTLGITPKRRA